MFLTAPVPERYSVPMKGKPHFVFLREPLNRPPSLTQERKLSLAWLGQDSTLTRETNYEGVSQVETYVSRLQPPRIPGGTETLPERPIVLRHKVQGPCADAFAAFLGAAKEIRKLFDSLSERAQPSSLDHCLVTLVWSPVQAHALLDSGFELVCEVYQTIRPLNFDFGGQMPFSDCGDIPVEVPSNHYMFHLMSPVEEGTS